MSSKKKRSAGKRREETKQFANADTLTLRKERNLLFLPVVLAMAIIPLTVHLVIVTLDPSAAALVGNTLYGDLFSHSKATVLMIFAAIMLIAAAVKRKELFVQHDRQYMIYLVAAGVFLLFAFLSSILSKYPSIAFWGGHDRAEGFITLFCYFVLLLFTVAAYRTEADFKNVLIALSIVVVVSSVLGIFQYCGHDLFNTDFGKALIISPWDSNNGKSAVEPSAPGTLYGTFFHYDYVGSFAAITAPIFLILAIAEKSRREKIGLSVMTLLSLWLLFGSTSRAGIVGVAAAFVFGIIIFARIIAKEWKISLCCLAVILVGVVSLNFASKGKMFARIPSLVQDACSVFQSSNSPDYLTKLPVKDVSTHGSTVSIVTQKGDTLNATLSSQTLSLKDENGKTVKVETKNGTSAIIDPRFNRFGFSFVGMGTDNSLGLAVTIDGQQQFYFRVNPNMALEITNPTGTVNIGSIQTPPTFGFKGKEKLGSARGYIWSRAFPMVPSHLLLGSGPDTFMMNFPQNDLFGKYWAYGTTNMVVDKPHDLYLQILLSDGGIAFLAFMVIVLFYLVDSIRLYALKREYQGNRIFGAATCLGIIGYLFAGFFNDSIISVAPVFWIMLGVGIAINFQNRRKTVEKQL